MKNDKFILHPGLIQDLEAAFRRNGWTREYVKKIATGNLLQQFGDVLSGHTKIETTPHVIDCSVNPEVPFGCTVAKHLKGEVFVWNPEEIGLYPSNTNLGGAFIVRGKLGKEIEGKTLLNANVLDYLFKNQHLIPDGWKVAENIYSWGTVYDGGGGLQVRCLIWEDGGWHRGSHWMSNLPDELPGCLREIWR